MQKLPPEALAFRLDAGSQQLWNETERVALPPKAFAVLCCLVENAGQVVGRRQLLEAAWDDVAVTADAVRYTLGRLRRALRDPAEAPRFIETVPRLGWRFIGRVIPAGDHVWIVQPQSDAAETPHEADHPTFVGRDTESDQLVQQFARAQAGNRQLVFVTGEPGIGKTALTNAFLTRIRSTPNLAIAQGNCIEHYGGGEPYLPALEALEGLCATIGGSGPIETLRRHAPMWLAQLPSLTEPEERVQISQQIQGATQQRMIREFARAIETLARDHPIVLWIDDLHWSDTSTLELLAFLLQRREPARLLVIATHRPFDPEDELGARLDALRSELKAHGLCRELPLSFLSQQAVRQHLEARFGAFAATPPGHALAEYVHHATSGNPLFMVSVVDELVSRGVLTREGESWTLGIPPAEIPIPGDIEALLSRQIGSLDETQREVLEIASVAGVEFSALAVEAGCSLQVEAIEAACEALARTSSFLVACGPEVWPDGASASRYRFVHALHREVFGSQLTEARRARLHRDIGLRKEEAFGERAAEIAAELARHFELGHDIERAVAHYGRAGEQAAQLSANHEACGYLRKALECLSELPSEKRPAHEIPLRIALCAPLAATSGYGAPELERNLARIQELTRSLDESPVFFPVILGLWSLHLVRGDLEAACGLGTRLVRISEQDGSPLSHLQGHRSLGHALFYRGELERSAEHLETALGGYDVPAHQRIDYSFGDDPVVLSFSYLAWCQWFRGAPLEAMAASQQAVAVGERLGHPPSLAFGLAYHAVLQHLRHDVPAALEASERSLALASDHGMPLWIALSRIVHGWAVAERGDAALGIEELADGLAAWESSGSDVGRPYFLVMLAEACARGGQLERAGELLPQVGPLIERTEQWVFAAERDRIEGELRWRDGAAADGEALNAALACFERAAHTARHQGAHGLELRALLSWGEVLERTGRAAEGVETLREARARYPAVCPEPDVERADTWLARNAPQA